MKINYRKIFLGLMVLVISLIATPVRAVNYLLDNINCINSGLCTPCDLIQVGVNVTQIIIGLSGVVVFLIFIYGGILWMISFGDVKKVEKGKSAMQAAVIGMVIIFFSYSLVELMWQAFKKNGTFNSSIQCAPVNYGKINNNSITTTNNNTTNTTNNTNTNSSATNNYNTNNIDLNSFYIIEKGEDWNKVQEYFNNNNEATVYINKIGSTPTSTVLYNNNNQNLTLNPNPEVEVIDHTQITVVDSNPDPDNETLNIMMNDCPNNCVCSYSATGYSYRCNQ